MTVVLTPQATAKAQGEPIFKALAATTLKAQVAIADGKLTVTLAVPATMKEDEWLGQLTAFMKGLLAVVNPQPEKSLPPDKMNCWISMCAALFWHSDTAMLIGDHHA